MADDVRFEIIFTPKETTRVYPEAVARYLTRLLRRELVVELGREERMFTGVEVRACSETREGDEGWLAREGVRKRGLECG